MLNLVLVHCKSCHRGRCNNKLLSAGQYPDLNWKRSFLRFSLKIEYESYLNFFLEIQDLFHLWSFSNICKTEMLHKRFSIQSFWKRRRHIHNGMYKKILFKIFKKKNILVTYLVSKLKLYHHIIVSIKTSEREKDNPCPQTNSLNERIIF